MKIFYPLAFFATVSTSVLAEQGVKAEIHDVYKTVTEKQPNVKKQCEIVEVPVYGTITREGNAAEGALLGMIIGGAIGKGLTGDKNAGAAGAVMGGIIGADKGSKPKTETVITGYREEEKCHNVTYYVEIKKKVYDYSTITWTLEGKDYQTKFVK